MKRGQGMSWTSTHAVVYCKSFLQQVTELSGNGSDWSGFPHEKLCSTLLQLGCSYLTHNDAHAARRRPIAAVCVRFLIKPVLPGIRLAWGNFLSCAAGEIRSLLQCPSNPVQRVLAESTVLACGRQLFGRHFWP